MKVILLQDVAKIGRKSQIVEVPDGYARNQLIPKRMAEPASLTNTKRIEKAQASANASKEANQTKFEMALNTLKDNVAKISVEVNEKGHTFRAVNESDVVSAVKQIGVNLEANMISIDSPIKEVGRHEVELRVGTSKAKFTIEVISNK